MNNSSSQNDSTSPAHSPRSDDSYTTPATSIVGTITDETKCVAGQNLGNSEKVITDNPTTSEQRIPTSSPSKGEGNGFEVVPNQLPFIETVPISSYTSSDEEDECDEFFDAEEDVTVVDDIENSLKAEEIEAVQNAHQQSEEQNILDMNDVMKTEKRNRTRTNSNRYLNGFFFSFL